MKLRCPDCQSLVAPVPGGDTLCTLCGFTAATPGFGKKDTRAVAFPSAWTPGQAKPQVAKKAWVVVREASDAPPKPKPVGTPVPPPAGKTAAPRPAAAAPRAANAAPAKPAPSLPKPATPAPVKAQPAAPERSARKGKMHWLLVLILSVLTLGAYGIYWVLRHRKK